MRAATSSASSRSARKSAATRLSTARSTSSAERNSQTRIGASRVSIQIETRDAPILVWLFLSAEDVDRAVDKRVAADFRADLDDAEDVAARIKFEDPMVVPLTQVKMIP